MNYKKFYELTCAYLLNVAGKHGLDEEKLEKYFIPTNTGLPEENGINDLSRIYKKICFHAQNGGMKGGVINFIKNFSIIKEITCNFNAEEFLKKYSSWEEVYRDFSGFLPEGTRELTKTGRNGQTIKQLYCKTLYSGAKFVSEFKNYDEFVNTLLSKEDFSPEFISYNVDGFGIALSCDFLKELDPRFDMCKPDRHVKNCIKEITKIDDSIKGDKLDHLVRQRVKQMASAVGVTAYKLDKIIYLICSEYFYQDDGKKNNSDEYRKAYIEYIMSEMAKK